VRAKTGSFIICITHDKTSSGLLCSLLFVLTRFFVSG
jgi:hypothetical protein